MSTYRAVDTALKAGSHTPSLVSRCVHLRITPALKSIRESREILKIVKAYGDVVMFRNLKYDKASRAKNTVITAFRRPESAADLLRASPLRFTLEPEKPYGPIRSVASGGLNELYDMDPPDAPRAPPVEPETQGTEFEISISKSYADPELVVQRRSLSWGFKIVPTFAGDALKLDLPIPGLASMPGQVEEMPARIVRNELDKVMMRKALGQIYTDGRRGGENSRQDDSEVSSDMTEK